MKKFNEFIIEYKISLQEKRKAKREPGASNEKPTGSVSKGTYKSSPEGQKRYKAAKVDIEVKQGLKDAGASGDFSPTMSPEARKKAQAIRDARTKRLATPDPFDDDYAKKTAKVDKRTKVGKKIGSAFEAPKKPTTAAPPGDFGPGDTKGQMNVKGMDRKAFKITKPEDIKKTAGYKPFAKLSRDIQDYKDRDVPGGPKKTGGTSFRGSPSGSRFDPDIGMADDDSARRRQKKVEDALNKAKKKQKGYSFRNKPTPGSEPIKFDPSNRSKESSTYRKKSKITGDYDERSAYKNLKTKNYDPYSATKFGKNVDTAAGRAQFDARKLKRMSKLRYKGLGGKPNLRAGRLIDPIKAAVRKNPRTAIAVAGLSLLGAGLYNATRPKKGALNAFRNSTYDKTVYHAKGPKAGKPVQYTYRAKNPSINPPGIGPASKPQTQRTLNKGIKSGKFKLK